MVSRVNQATSSQTTYYPVRLIILYDRNAYKKISLVCVTGACSVTTDLIMRVNVRTKQINVRTTTTTSPPNHGLAHEHTTQQTIKTNKQIANQPTKATGQPIASYQRKQTQPNETTINQTPVQSIGRSKQTMEQSI